MPKNMQQKMTKAVYYGIAGLIVILSLLALFFIIKIGLYPYQHEVREGAPLAITALMLKGINPYSFEVLPAYTYVYGILYPFFTLPLTYFFGIDIIQLRIANILFSFASLWLVISLVPKPERGLPHYLWVCVLLIGLLQKNIYGRPESLGLFFMLASVIVPYKAEYSKKSLILSAVFAVLGFYAKPYFIIGAGFTATALFLFVSKKTSLLYFTGTMILWASSLFIMHFIFPAYLVTSLFHHISVASYDLQHMIGQLRYFFHKETLLLFFYVSAALFLFCRIAKKIFWNLSFAINKPLLQPGLAVFPFDIFASIGLVFFIVKLGGHLGAGNALYLYDLVYPFIFLSILIKIKPQSLKDWQKVLIVLPCLFIIKGYPARLYQLFQRQTEYRASVQKIEALIDPSKNILNSADLASMVLKKNMPLNDSGQSEYFITGNTRVSKKIYGNQIEDTDKKYEALVAENVRNKQYDYIFVSWVGHYSLPKNFADYYKLSAAYDYPGLWNGGKVELWVPAEE